MDHLDPSDEEGEKDAKSQRSELTTARFTSSRPPREYDEVMGITQMEPRDAERFEEGIDSRSDRDLSSVGRRYFRSQRCIISPQEHL